MKKITFKFIIIMFFIVVFSIIYTGKVNAATFSIKSSTTTVEPGGTFNVIINSNGAGYVNLTCSNGSLSENYVWVEGSKTITCNASKSGNNVTISASGLIADFNTGKDEEKSGSISVTIKEKSVENNIPKPTTSNQSSESNKNTNNKNKTTNKKTTNTTNKNNTVNTTKKEEEIVVNEEDQGTEEELLVEDMNVFTIDKEGKKEEINLSPAFDGKTTEYTLNVENSIEKIEIDSKYNNEYKLKIEGLDDNLKVGENIVKITLSRNEESKVYTIKVIKEEEKIVDEHVEIKEEKKDNKLSFSIPEFIGIIIACVLIENIIILSIYKIIKARKQEKY